MTYYHLGNYYTRSGEIIGERDTIAAALTLERFYHEAGGVIWCDPTPRECGGVAFEDLYACAERYPGFLYCGINLCDELRAARVEFVAGYAYSEQPDGSYTFFCDPSWLEREGERYVIPDHAREKPAGVPGVLYPVEIHAPGYGCVSIVPAYATRKLAAWLDVEDLEQ